MITFLDGPARGRSFMLGRAPKYLRVVCDSKGQWDALDQLDDQPKPSESIHVYTRRDDLPISKYHMRSARCRGRSGYFFQASYSYLPEQPRDDQVRSNLQWQAWAVAQDLDNVALDPERLAKAEQQLRKHDA